MHFRCYLKVHTASNFLQSSTVWYRFPKLPLHPLPLCDRDIGCITITFPILERPKPCISLPFLSGAAAAQPDGQDCQRAAPLSHHHAVILPNHVRIGTDGGMRVRCKYILNEAWRLGRWRVNSVERHFNEAIDINEVIGSVFNLSVLWKCVRFNGKKRKMFPLLSDGNALTACRKQSHGAQNIRR